nr:peroxidase family protein [Ornithinimicrobium cryptoxanthini]
MIVFAGTLAIALIAFIAWGVRRRQWRKPVAVLGGAALAISLVPASAATFVSAEDSNFAPMATDEDPAFRLIPADLEFILKQIEISEAHAYAMETGDQTYSLLCTDNQDTSNKCVRSPMLPHGLRTVDGSFNNLEFDTATGKSNELMPRLLPIRWREGETAPPGAPTAGDTSMCEDPAGTCYEQYDGLVYDSQPRVISNLVVDNTTNNPTVAEAAANNPDSVIDPVTGELYLPNMTADEALSPPVNMWFVFFGQFFDHGLDLVDKSPTDSIIVPLSPNDPLFNPATPHLNFMAMSRATNQPGEDEILGTADDVRQHQNRTTPWVDQNQTYTSHPAHQVFIREYISTTSGPKATGRLLNGPNGGLATWDAVQEQALTVLGINLVDESVLNVPQVYVDLYGQFIPGPNGFPQLFTPDGGPVEASTASPFLSTDAIPLSQSFLDDIAHGATPADPIDDPSCTEAECPQIPGYDNVLLGEHFITGDGRGNENIGLSTVHHVFHSEHNRLVDHVTSILDANPDLKARFQSSNEADDWTYNERIFQAARFTNEMQYQHLVFEEFARTVQPAIDPVVFNENAYDSTIDASIKAEFAHVVYRFGHSMLTEDIRREGFGSESALLLDGFLNPRAYHCAVPLVPGPTEADPQVCPSGSVLDPEQAAGVIVNGTTNQVANQVDELVTSTLRNNLLGLPLDLPTINIMRGRDAGVPGLQQARRTFYEDTGSANLEPYSSWRDFGLSLKNGENFGRGPSTTSLVNFVAAYGQHPTVLDAATLNGKRAAAEALVNGISTVQIVDRISGANRFATAAAVSADSFTTANTVYVASGNNYPDALAGGPAAAVEGGPVLLLGQNSIPLPTLQEIVRLQPQRIVVLGGTTAISEQVFNSLETYAPTVERRAGANRYETAALVTQNAFTSANRVYIASGANYADALGGAAAAAASGSPLLLVYPGSVPTETSAELARLSPSEIVVLGGESAISPAVVTALETVAPVTRLGGINRYQTSELVSQHFATPGGTVYIATGTSYPDALAASSPAGLSNAPILLVPPTGLTASLEAELLRLAPNRVVVLGGVSTIPDSTMVAIQALFPAAEGPADREAFMNSTGTTWGNAAGGISTTGLEDVDFWVGGLAESLDPFGGMLGSTFNHVFEQQLEDLQFGDRFYYLFRNQGNQLFSALEANTFSNLIQRNTDASLLPADIFLSHSPYLDLENLPDPLPEGLSLTPNGTYRWDGDEHIEIHGNRTLGDRIRGGQGDDSLWGYGGDDIIEGGSGNDTIQGGPGKDIITDSFGDDNIKGGDGNDAIDGGPGIDLLLGQDGSDFVTKTSDNADGAVGFLGTGNDFFLGGTGRDNPFGNEGDDWMEGGPHADLLMGDNGQQFQDDVDGGDDVLIGGPGSDDMDAEGGDDIMVATSGGTDRYHGMFGFDYVTYYGTSGGVDADLNFNLLQPPDVTAIRDRFTHVEALSGGSGDDVIRGLGVAPDDLAADEVNMATREGFAKIDGLTELLKPSGHEQDYTLRFLADNPLRQDNDGVSTLLFGGPGSDVMEGRFGDDFIDGDAMLRVQLEHNGTRYNSLSQLKAGVFAGNIDPGDISIVREIVIVPDDEGVIDTAVYADPFLNAEGVANYEINQLPDGYWEIVHVGGPEFEESEGADILRNIEMLQFGDGGCFELSAALTPCASMGTIAFTGAIDPPTEDAQITATVTFEDAEGNPTVTSPQSIRFSWQAGEVGEAWDPSPTEGGPITRGAADNTWQQSFTPGDGDAGAILRVVVTFLDDNGQLRQVVSGVVGGPDNLAVVNIPDDPTGLTLSTMTPRVGQSVLPSGFTDPDGLEEAVDAGMTYEWQTSSTADFSSDIRTVATKEVPTTNQIGYTVEVSEVARYLRVVVTYTDDQGTLTVYPSPVTEAILPAEML